MLTFFALSIQDSAPMPSSRKVMILITFALKNFTGSLKTFVNIYPAVDIPKGKTLKT